MTLSILFKRVGITAALALSSAVWASTTNFGLLVGDDETGNAPPLGLLVDTSGNVTNLNLFNLEPSGTLYSSAINDLGIGLIGGEGNVSNPPFFPIGFHVSPTGMVTDLDIVNVIADGIVNGVAINASGLGFLGGVNTTLFPNIVPFAFTVSPTGVLSSQLTFPVSTTGQISAIAINDSGTGLAGGADVHNVPFAFLLPPLSTTFTALDLSAVPNGGVITAAINASGAGLLAGQAGPPGHNPAIAFYLTPPTAVTQLPISTSNLANIFSVAINDSGAGLLGGTDFDAPNGPPIAYFVSPTMQLTPLDLSSIVNGEILSVSINNAGVGLIGGYGSPSQSSPIEFPIAYFVSPTPPYQLIPIDLSSIAQGETLWVGINQNGVGILGGENLTDPNNATPFAFLVCPMGQVIPLDLTSFTSNGIISSVALNNLLLSLCQGSACHIPTDGLSKNDLDLAKYINKYAPYDACYFIPSELDGTLKQALESTAPTRNAFALFTADNNLFFLNTMISRHSRDSRSFRRQTFPQTSLAMEESVTAGGSSELMLATIAVPTYCKRPEVEPCQVEERPYQLWGSVLGALSYQKANRQSPAFNPTTGGAILAFDAKATNHAWLGGGAAYAYSHIHEKQDAGYSNLNQELLFLYSLWDNTRLYFDVVLWGGLFQIDNVRHIHMTGFEFTSKSHPHGWQLSPHLELGYDFNSECNGFTVEPFVMFDWANNWQHRYKEKGSGPFNMVQKHHHSSFLRSEAGVRFYEVVPYENWSLVFQETAGYVNKKPFKVGTVNAFIVGAPGSFTVETFTTTQNLGVVEFELLFEPNDPHYPYGTIAYQGEFGSMYQSHLVSVDICWNF